MTGLSSKSLSSIRAKTRINGNISLLSGLEKWQHIIRHLFLGLYKYPLLHVKCLHAKWGENHQWVRHVDFFPSWMIWVSTVTRKWACHKFSYSFWHKDCIIITGPIHHGWMAYHFSIKENIKIWKKVLTDCMKFKWKLQKGGKKQHKHLWNIKSEVCLAVLRTARILPY